MTSGPQFETVSTNGIALNVARAGPEDGPLVILLHGFPEFWYGWRHQIGPLAEGGHRIMAPDQRGYNTSDKPEGITRYTVDELVGDVIGLIDSTGRERATLIGHDWGGIVAWWAALRYPGRVDRVAVLNAPHPVVMVRNLWGNPAQMLRSWYAFFFQLPGIPEALFRRSNWRAAARALVTTSRPGTFSTDDLRRYRRAWSEPGAFRSMIHWYRAAMRARPRTPADARIRVPTLLIWGTRDRFLGPELARPSTDLCDDGRLEFIEGASHWVQHEEADRVNRLLLDFLAEGPSAR